MSKTSCVCYHCHPCQVHERDVEEAPRNPLLCTPLFLYILLEVPLGGFAFVFHSSWAAKARSPVAILLVLATF